MNKTKKEHLLQDVKDALVSLTGQYFSDVDTTDEGVSVNFGSNIIKEGTLELLPKIAKKYKARSYVCMAFDYSKGEDSNELALFINIEA